MLTKISRQHSKLMFPEFKNIKWVWRDNLEMEVFFKVWDFQQLKIDNKIGCQIYSHIISIMKQNKGTIHHTGDSQNKLMINNVHL